MTYSFSINFSWSVSERRRYGTASTAIKRIGALYTINALPAINTLICRISVIGRRPAYFSSENRAWFVRTDLSLKRIFLNLVHDHLILLK